MAPTAFIHQRTGWPRFTWDSEALVGLLGAVRHAQGKHLGSMEALGLRHRTEANFEILTLDVIKSWAIEGHALNPGEVRSSIARRLGLESAGLPKAGREIEGVVEMMLDATQAFETPLSAERMFDWHASLFPTGCSGLRRIGVGAWRSEQAGPMQVVSGAVGRERVHFEAPDAERIKLEMALFLEWFNKGSPVDPLLRAGLAHFWFVTIHPFEDGNGRVARAIGNLALARADGSRERFYSLSSQIEAERPQYYLQLESAQRAGLDITEWLTWFLGCLDRAISSARDTLSSVLGRARLWQEVNRFPVNARQRKVINRLLDGFRGFLTSAKYAKIAGCSPDTALRDINELLGRGVLLKNPGGGRSTSYRLADFESDS